MTKGKLYDNIPEPARLGIGNTNEGDFISYTNHTANLKLLDEAKKEFEQINPNYEDNADWHDADLDEWFKKWFGDEE
jgi:hypothetical protein